jgi:hypothetical protein
MPAQQRLTPSRLTCTAHRANPRRFPLQVKAQHIDLYIRPNVSQFGLLQWGSQQDIEELGYREGKKMVREWKRELLQRGGWRGHVLRLQQQALPPPAAPAATAPELALPSPAFEGVAAAQGSASATSASVGSEGSGATSGAGLRARLESGPGAGGDGDMQRPALRMRRTASTSTLS